LQNMGTYLRQNKGDKKIRTGMISSGELEYALSKIDLESCD